MASVGLFFGSDTGNTEHVAKMIQKELGKQLIDVKDIAKSSKEDIAEFDLLIFGIP
ncbi:MAG: flavodoxin domain-containing protein, partial [Pseudomonadota bacterium]|nr:flavodoxin domain-containing protein [Enterobacterales bacterium]MEC9163865.1 flavodoxin domain-containing protein [Pseudomonadota bacterium]